MVSLTALNVFNAASFAPFTLPEYRNEIAPCRIESQFVALGALWADQPVGLAVGHVQADGSARLLSLYVQPEYRRRGIGASLLRGLEASMSNRGCARGEIRYQLSTSGTIALERTLARCAWPSTGDRLHCFMLDGQIASATWFRNAVLPADYAMAPWLTVTDDERRALAEAQVSERWIPAPLAPLQFEMQLDAETSLVLRRHGSIVGWALTREIDEQTLHYRNLYVRPSCNRVGQTFAALALLAEAVRRQAAARGVRSRGVFEVSPDNRGFLRFITRHLANDLLSTSVMQRIVKLL